MLKQDIITLAQHDERSSPESPLRLTDYLAMLTTLCVCGPAVRRFRHFLDRGQISRLPGAERSTSVKAGGHEERACSSRNSAKSASGGVLPEPLAPLGEGRPEKGPVRLVSRVGMERSDPAAEGQQGGLDPGRRRKGPRGDREGDTRLELVLEQDAERKVPLVRVPGVQLRKLKDGSLGYGQGLVISFRTPADADPHQSRPSRSLRTRRDMGSTRSNTFKTGRVGGAIFFTSRKTGGVTRRISTDRRTSSTPAGSPR